ncbi:MAG: hypothetical protein J7J31_10350 [Helicobacteraceae bacterium]|nr:hypothetical protein [Helicobacteraceae bacterium]
MRYSYISPRKKSAITQEMQLLLMFFSITVFMLFLTSSFLFFKDYRFQAQKEIIWEKKEQLSLDVAQMQEHITFIQKEEALAHKVFMQNSVLKDSITNLFDLIPERITISEANLLKNGLIIYGITPNKDVYNFMLQAPLRSIFHKTYSSFYPYENGWLRFVSTNYIDEEEESFHAR